MTAPVEWDWPPQRRRRNRPDGEPALDLQLRVSRVRRTSNAPAPRRSIGDRVANAFFWSMVTLAKLAVAAFCSALVLGSIAMIVVLIQAAMK